jgi:transcription initiation factor TFIIIB Brf1 subunit/transcription initiation factor TFIIB
MSGARSRNLSSNQCPHKETIEDDREGYEVCTQCGLVLQQLFGNVSRLIEEEKNVSVYNFLLDTCANAHIPSFIVDYANSYFNKICAVVKKDKRRKNTDLAIAAYCLYESLSRHQIPRTAQEIEQYTNIETSTLWAIESALNIKYTLDHPLDFVDRFCALLELPFYHAKIIKGIVGNMFGLGNIRPQCVVGVVIFLYCKEQKIRLSIKNISETCGVSSTNIYKIVKNIKKPFADNISLLYT